MPGNRDCTAALRQSHRRAQLKHSELVTRIEVARSAWSALFSDPERGKPVSVMLEVKLIDQIQARADSVLKELQPISHGSLPQDETGRASKAAREGVETDSCIERLSLDIEESLSGCAGLPAT